jgi:hypothetical protein
MDKSGGRAPVTPGKPCRFFSQSGHCRSGNACKFAHVGAITHDPAVIAASPGKKGPAEAAPQRVSATPGKPQQQQQQQQQRKTNKEEKRDESEDTFAFMSDASYLKAGRATPHSEMVVAGVCWDGSTTNRPGARHGPAAIRTASHMLVDGTHPVFEVCPLEPRGRLGDAGDFMLPNTSIERMRSAMAPMVIALLKRHRQIVFLGGDHSITLPILRAYRAHFGRPLAVLHFDAHCDTWKDHFGFVSYLSYFFLIFSDCSASRRVTGRGCMRRFKRDWW